MGPATVNRIPVGMSETQSYHNQNRRPDDFRVAPHSRICADVPARRRSDGYRRANGEGFRPVSARRKCRRHRGFGG